MTNSSWHVSGVSGKGWSFNLVFSVFCSRSTMHSHDLMSVQHASSHKKFPALFDDSHPHTPFQSLCQVSRVDGLPVLENYRNGRTQPTWFRHRKGVRGSQSCPEVLLLSRVHLGDPEELSNHQKEDSIPAAYSRSSPRSMCLENLQCEHPEASCLPKTSQLS